MTNATDVIAYLLPRKAAPIVERQTGLPFGWGLWLRALPERLGRITRERADAVVATLAARASPRGPDASPFAPGGKWIESPASRRTAANSASPYRLRAPASLASIRVPVSEA